MRKMMVAALAAGLAGLVLLGCGGSDGGGIDADTVTVRGRVRWAASTPFPSNADLRVSVWDAEYADGPATLLGEQRLNDVPFSAGAEDGVPFSVAVDGPLDPRDEYRYRVRVGMDVNGDGLVGQGDYISESITPVLEEGRLRPSVSVDVTELEPCGTPGAGGFCASGPGKPL